VRYISGRRGRHPSRRHLQAGSVRYLGEEEKRKGKKVKSEKGKRGFRAEATRLQREKEEMRKWDEMRLARTGGKKCNSVV